MPDGVLIGFVMGLILAIIAAIFGKRVGEKQAVVTKQDVMDGIITRKAQAMGLEENTHKVMEDAIAESEIVSQRIKEAPNEEIVRMFIAAFDSPPDQRSNRH